MTGAYNVMLCVEMPEYSHIMIFAGIFTVDVNDFPHDPHAHLPNTHYPSGATLVFFPDWHPPKYKTLGGKRKRKKVVMKHRKKPTMMYGPLPKSQVVY